MKQTSYNVASEFEDIYQKISSNKILNITDRSELPIYIQPYPIQFEEKVNEQILLLESRLSKLNKALHINLYDLVLEMLRADGILNEIIDYESEIDKRNLLETLCQFITNERIMQKIGCLVKKSHPNIIILSGIAALFPYVRAHNILNNMPEELYTVSTLLFYPGYYNNESLILFGENGINEDNYYRAHNLSTIKIK